MEAILRRNFGKVILLCAAILITQCNPSKQNEVPDLIPDEDNGGLSLPDGFHALVVADNLGRGRHIDINNNGDIYMSLRQLNNGNGIVALRDTTGDVRIIKGGFINITKSA